MSPDVLTASTVAQETGTPVDAEELREQKLNDRFLSLLKKRPRQGTAFDKVYAFHLDRGSLDKLIADLQANVTATEDNGESLMVLGMVHLRRGNETAAVEAFQKASDVRGHDAVAAWYLGEALIEAGRTPDAIAALEEALSREPSKADAAEIYPLLGRLYQRSQNLEKALAVWRRYEASFPDDERVQEQIASILADEGQLAAAIERYSQLANSARDPYRRIDFGIKAARLQLKDGQTQTAIAAFEDLLEQLKPGSWLHADVRGSIEQTYLQRDDFAGLIDYYKGWLQRYPEDVDAMSRIGRYLAWQGAADEAADWYQKAISKAPSDISLRQAFIEHLVGNRQFAAAIDQYEALTRLDNTNPDTIERWGALYLRRDDLEKNERQQNAARIWKQLLSLKPDDAGTLAKVADLLRSAQQTEDAIALYRQAIQLQPDEIQYREYLGEFYHSLNRPDQAKTAWNAIATGDRRTTSNLMRLSEIYSGFGYTAEAVDSMQAACELTPSFNDLIRYAGLLRRESKAAESLAVLQRAEELAASDEDSEIVLTAKIRSLLESGQLESATIALANDLKQTPSSDGYRKLAQYYEALNALPEASTAAQQAVRMNADSLSAVLLSAQLSEKAGLLADASAAYSRLVQLDPRARTDHFRKVAELERRLGRIDRALQAGQALIAAAPENPEHYRFFADLCFSTGQSELAMETLRKSVRANPGDSAALISLAAVLADQFKTQEAIDLYWRAFDGAQNQDERLTLCQTLTELYLRTNHFDRLVTRLENLARTSSNRRDLVLCLANVYQAGGDLGMARETLEQLLDESGRDASLLKELSQLAEQTADFDIAAKYQRQLNDIKPSSEGTIRLASLLTRSGNDAAAAAVWTSADATNTPPQDVIASIDQLLAAEKFEAAMSLSSGLLRRDARDWEALLRHVVIAAATDDNRQLNEYSRRLLELDLPNDAVTHAAATRSTIDIASSAAAVITVPPANRPTPPLMQYEQQLRGILSLLGVAQELNSYLNAAFQTQDAQKRQAMLNLMYYTNETISGNPTSYANRSRGLELNLVTDFAAARAISIAAQVKLASDRGELDAALQNLETAAVDPTATPQAVWDWYIASVASNVLGQTQPMLKVAHRLAVFPDADAQLAVLKIFRSRDNPAGLAMQSQTQTKLASEQVGLMLQAAKTVVAREPDWLNYVGGARAVSADLGEAEQTSAANEFYAWLTRNDASTAELKVAVPIAQARNDANALIALADRIVTSETTAGNGFAADSFASATLGTVFAQVASYVGPIDGNWDAVDRLLKQFLTLRSQQAEATLTSGAHGLSKEYFNAESYPIYRNGKATALEQVTTLASEPYWSAADLTFFVNLHRLYGAQRFSQLLDAVAAVRKDLNGTAAAAVELAAAQFQFLNGAQDAAAVHLVRAAVLSPNDTSLRLNLARFHQQAGHKHDALSLLDTIAAADQATIKEREMLAMSLASDLGNTQRAELAAGRLFGLSLTPRESIALASQAKVLKLTEMADALLARAQKSGGNDLNTLVTLMNEYAGGGKGDIANQIAHQILRRTAVSNPRQDPTQLHVARSAAIRILGASGKLDSLIERVQEQLSSAPNSLQLHQTLQEYYVAAGRTTEAAAIAAKIRELEPMTPARMKSDVQSLVRARKYNEASDLYLRIMDQDPQDFSDQYYLYITAFREAGRIVELADRVLETDVQQLRNNYQIVSQLVQTLFSADNGSATSRPPSADRIERGTALLKLGWDAFPTSRSDMISGISAQAVWDQPVMLTYVRDVLIPETPQRAIARPWNGVAMSTVRKDDGRMTGIVTRLAKHLDSAEAKAFTSEVQAGVTQYPQWMGGRLLLAILQARTGLHEEAMELLRQVTNSENVSYVPLQAAWVLATELAQIDRRYLPIAASILQDTLQQDLNAGTYLTTYINSPQRFLFDLLYQIGRSDEVPGLLNSLDTADPHFSVRATDRALVMLQWYSQVGDHLNQLGLPLDALHYYVKITPELIDAVGPQTSASYVRSIVSESAQEMASIRNSATAEQFLRYLDNGLQQTPPRVELMLQPSVDGFQHDNLESPVLDVARRITRSSAVNAKRLSDGLTELVQRGDSKVSSVAVVAIVVSQVDNNLRLQQLGLKDLDEHLKYVAANHVPPSDNDVALWIPARMAIADSSTRSLGFALLDRCEKAAQSSIDDGWLLSILRWRGEIELAAGNRSAAEEAWSRLLDAVLQDASAPTETRQTPGASNPGQTSGPNSAPSARLSTTALEELRSQLLNPEERAE